MANFSPAKRALFRKLANTDEQVLRPPWAQEEYLFVDTCTGCRDCAAVCPESIIEFDSLNRPKINFHNGECTFCGECVNACQSHALKKSASPWNAKVSINSDCLAEKQILCRSCSEVCEHEAIQFSALSRLMSRPTLNLDVCNGCGACVAICPTEAISVTNLHQTSSI